MLKALVLWANTKQKAPQKALKSKKMAKFFQNDKKKKKTLLRYNSPHACSMHQISNQF
ncbi:hypothetical protein UBN115_09850 [Helicobacter pylori]